MPPKCPECSSAKVAKIVYGLPARSWDWKKDVGAGKVPLGGCCIPENPRRWECNFCGHEWGKQEI